MRLQRGHCGSRFVDSVFYGLLEKLFVWVTAGQKKNLHWRYPDYEGGDATYLRAERIVPPPGPGDHKLVGAGGARPLPENGHCAIAVMPENWFGAIVD